MSDRHTPSTSDELLDRARSASGGSEPASFQPESPVDEYEIPTSFDPSSAASDLGADLDIDDLSAEEIAAALMERDATDKPVDDAHDAVTSESDEPSSGASSLPSWATDDPVETPRPTEQPSPMSDEILFHANLEESDPSESPSEASTMWTGEERWDGEPSEEWLAYEAKQNARRQSRAATLPIKIPRARTLIAFGFLAFFGFGMVLNLIDGREPIETAVVGDCFTAGDALEIDQVAIVPCTEEHDSEVFAIVDATPVFGTSYPGEDALFDWLFDECLDHFPGYTGESYETSRYYFDTLIPTSDAWRFGDHEGMCTLILLDEDDNLLISTSSGARGAPDTDSA